ncbi:glycosyltransferase family 2 protein [Paenibacillus thermotolerans]|uniref:glycosyltransferase family 2 protein n=1 Tax=Paenibacillus thermotolerans TaxID=3027807 RepID=UPI002368D55B|nr:MULTISPECIES: glycosyltransferase [unclassified Paenibacillus]
MSDRSRISVIIPARNEGKQIRSVVREAKRLQPLEIVIVLNGSTDETKSVCRQEGCRIIEYERSLGNDVGRAVGAYYAQGDVLLFLDGDIPIEHHRLSLFVKTIEQGHDVALNNLSWSLTLTKVPHVTAAAKYVTNRLIDRQDLTVNSLIAIPHAMSRKAVQQIGWRNLANPVLAQCIAVEKRLSIAAPVSINVISSNRPRPDHSKYSDNAVFPDSTTRILGDHLAALSHVIQLKGERGGFPEGARNRGFLQSYKPVTPAAKAKRSAIIPVGQEGDTIQDVIRSVRRAGVDEIIVVANGSDSKTIHQAQQTGAKVFVFRHALGHNVGRAIGAACSTGDICVFVDGDFVIPPEDIKPFIDAVENGTDIALNKLDMLFERFQPADPISAVKYFVNICMKQPQLLNASMTAVPHAVHRRVIDRIGWRSLMIPPLAQVKAATGGARIRPVHYVDVIAPNRPRSDHMPVNGRIEAFDRIYGDHMEAIAYLIRKNGPRGGFADFRHYEIMKRLRG